MVRFFLVLALFVGSIPGAEAKCGLVETPCGYHEIISNVFGAIHPEHWRSEFGQLASGQFEQDGIAIYSRSYGNVVFFSSQTDVYALTKNGLYRFDLAGTGFEYGASVALDLALERMHPVARGWVSARGEVLKMNDTDPQIGHDFSNVSKLGVRLENGQLRLQHIPESQKKSGMLVPFLGRGKAQAEGVVSTLLGKLVSEYPNRMAKNRETIDQYKKALAEYSVQRVAYEQGLAVWKQGLRDQGFSEAEIESLSEAYDVVDRPVRPLQPAYPALAMSKREIVEMLRGWTSSERHFFPAAVPRALCTALSAMRAVSDEPAP
ncbi:MAG: hypothetical protein AB7P04_05200 [Bacteriovoracia bacterium]